MRAPREVELKLAVSTADLPRLRARLQAFGAPRSELLQTTYYDTEDFALAGRGIALRVRRAGTRWLQTLKTGDRNRALSRRGEWEMPAPRGQLDLTRFRDTPLAALPRTEVLKIAPRFRTRFKRTTWTTRDGAIEIALDDGAIVAGKRTRPILELELELKSGPAEALLRLARQLAGARTDALALLPLGASKAARGVRLARGDAVAPTKANAKAFAPALAKCDRAAQALRTVVATATDILLADAVGLRDSDDPEFIHQARVAVRRMRSAIRLFDGETAFPARLATDLRWIGRELGGARDWDVIVLHTLPSFVPAAADNASPLRAAAEERRAQARRHALASLASPRFARLALRLLQWSQAPIDAGAVGAPLKQFAPKALRRARRRLLKAAYFFVALAPEEQHRVRILAKRLRYAIDVLAGVFRRGATDDFSQALSSLQDVLGELHDIAVAQAVLADLPAPSVERAATRAALDALTERRRTAAIAAESALARLAQLPEPWR